MDTTVSERKPRMYLERRAIRHELIADLASGDWMQLELAEKFGVSKQAIWNFKTRHAADIEAAKAAFQ